MKKIIFIAVAMMCMLFVACSSGGAEYKSDMSAKDLATEMAESIGLNEESMAFSDEGRVKAEHLTEVDFEKVLSYAAYSSTVSTSLDEIVVVQANSVEDANALKSQVEESVENMQEIRKTYSDYLPEEYKKVEDTKVLQLGVYLIYTVLDGEMSDTAISTAQDLLK